MDINTLVSIAPENVRDILSEEEMNQLINVIDKLLISGQKLEIKYFEKKSEA